MRGLLEVSERTVCGSGERTVRGSVRGLLGVSGRTFKGQ